MSSKRGLAIWTVWTTSFIWFDTVMAIYDFSRNDTGFGIFFTFLAVVMLVLLVANIALAD
jgi:hypothetical protein